MPRLLLTVVRGQARQRFELDADSISLGRSPDSTLVLPLPFVAETHLLIQSTPDGHLALLPASPITAVLFNSQPVPPQGLAIPATDPFLLEIPDTLTAGPPLQIEAAFLLPSDLSPTPTPSRPQTHSGRRGLLAASLVLLVTILVAASTLLPSRAPTSQSASSTPTTNPTTTPTHQAPTLRAAELLESAAAALTAGDLPAARNALDNATASGATGPLVDALSLALRTETARQTGQPIPPSPTSPDSTPPNRQAPAPAPESPTTASSPESLAARGAPITLPFDTATTATSTDPRPPTAPSPTALVAAGPSRSLSPADADRLIRDHAATAIARDTEYRDLLARAQADARAGRDPRLTETGRAALKTARQLLIERHPNAELTFPDDLDPTTLILFENGLYTLRGHFDQWNQSRIPLRTFYLIRLKPTPQNTFTPLSIDLLQ